jgi:hypothetical protein
MAFGAFIAGATAAMVVGFGWGGWLTGGTAKGRVNEAVLALNERSTR